MTGADDPALLMMIQPQQTPTARISEIVDNFIEHRKGELAKDSIAQVRQAANLFIFANEDLAFCDVRQSHAAPSHCSSPSCQRITAEHGTNWQVV